MKMGICLQQKLLRSEYRKKKSFSYNLLAIFCFKVYRHKTKGMSDKQFIVTRQSPAIWRVTFNNPPLNIFGAKSMAQAAAVVSAIESDEQLKVVIFDSAVATKDRRPQSYWADEDPEDHYFPFLLDILFAGPGAKNRPGAGQLLLQVL
jgi:hypothetical protein